MIPGVEPYVEPVEDELEFNLRRPCKDCPFRKNPSYRMPKHIEHMGLLLEPMMNGNAAHTCHLTDPRSDNPGAKDYKGPLEHCVGMILMCEKKPGFFRQKPYFRAAIKKKLDLTKLQGADEVWTVGEFAEAVYGVLSPKQKKKVR